MNHPPQSVYQQVIEKTKGAFFRTQVLRSVFVLSFSHQNTDFLQCGCCEINAFSKWHFLSFLPLFPSLSSSLLSVLPVLVPSVNHGLVKSWDEAGIRLAFGRSTFSMLLLLAFVFAKYLILWPRLMDVRRRLNEAVDSQIWKSGRSYGYTLNAVVKWTDVFIYCREEKSFVVLLCCYEWSIEMRWQLIQEDFVYLIVVDYSTGISRMSMALASIHGY